jgi:hypothetical protein
MDWRCKKGRLTTDQAGLSVSMSLVIRTFPQITTQWVQQYHIKQTIELTLSLLIVQSLAQLELKETKTTRLNSSKTED